MPKNVTWAKLHAPLFIPGTHGAKSLNLKETLPPDNKTLKDLKLTLEDDGTLTIQWSDGRFIKRYVVGAANVAGVMLEAIINEVSTDKSSSV